MANDLGRQALIDALRANNPQLVAAGSYGSAGRVVAAKNMRIQLKAAFPGVKFSVKGESYAGGSSICVYWVDGPTRDAVELIIKRYQYGKFDGTQDLYEGNASLWHRAFGGAQYVFAERSYSDQAINEAIAALGYADKYDADMYNEGELSRIVVNGDYLSSAIRNFMKDIDYAIGQSAN